jgi:hypothetical protein
VAFPEKKWLVEKDEASREQPRKKPYTPPELTVFGTVERLTKNGDIGPTDAAGAGFGSPRI